MDKTTGTAMEKLKDIRDQRVSEVCICKLIEYFGVTELLDAIGCQTVEDYVDECRAARADQQRIAPTGRFKSPRPPAELPLS